MGQYIKTAVNGVCAWMGMPVLSGVEPGVGFLLLRLPAVYH